MKLVPLRSLVFAGLFGVCAVGLLSTNVGCGSDSPSGTTGKGGAGGSSTGAGGSSATGSGGSTGAGGGGTVTHKVNYTFDSSNQGWMLNTYYEPANLGGVAPADAGVDAGAGPAPTVVFDSTDGSPTAGSLKVTAAFTGYDKYVDALINPAMPIDVTGKTLHAKVKLVSVSDPLWTGGVQIHASTGAYVYANPTGMALTTVGTWTDLIFDLSIIDATTKPGWDPAMAVQFGVQFYSGSAPTTNPITAFPVTAVFAIDTYTD